MGLPQNCSATNSPMHDNRYRAEEGEAVAARSHRLGRFTWLSLAAFCWLMALSPFLTESYAFVIPGTDTFLHNVDILPRPIYDLAAAIVFPLSGLFPIILFDDAPATARPFFVLVIWSAVALPTTAFAIRRCRAHSPARALRETDG